MRRFDVMILLFVLSIILPTTSHAMGGYAPMPSEKPVINKIDGTVQVKSEKSEVWRAARDGMLLDQGDTVKTGPDGKCEIFHAGGSFRMYGNTAIIIPLFEARDEAVSIKRVRMDVGSGIFRSSPRGVDDGFEVQTLYVIAGVKGTIFSVINTPNGTIVSVFRGSVLVTDTNRTPASETLLGPGRRVTVSDGEGFGKVQVFTPWNAWRGWSRDDEPPLEDPSPPSDGGDDEVDDYKGGMDTNR